MNARWLPMARVAQLSAMLIAGVSVSSLTDTAAMPSLYAACEGEVVTADIALATEKFLATTTLKYPPGNLVRTTSLLTVPTGARWDTCLARGSLVLTIESGTLKVTVTDGFVWIVSQSGAALGTPLLRELPSGESTVLSSGKWLIVHGPGMLVAQNVGQGDAVVEVVRVT